MASPLPSAGREFDLAAEAAYARRGVRTARIFMAGAGIFFTLLGFWITLPSPNLSSTEGLGFGALLWGLAAMFYFLAYRLRRNPPLDGLSLRATALQMRFADGVELTKSWTDPAFGLSMFDYAHDSSATKSEGRHVWIAASSDRGGTIPHEVLAEIVASARAHGLPVLIRKEVIMAGAHARTPEVTRVGRPEETPGWSDASPATPR
jgi:hypothetical protein